MFDLLKKTLLTGVGVTLMTADKVEEVARDIARSAQLPAEKGEEFVKEALARAEKGRRELDERIQKAVQEALRSADVPTRADFDQLAARVAQLEQQSSGAGT